ncbi:MAG: hypothetical protein HFJ52_00795 [Clostridia bacterium]|nr:hypothetical protein [Clostridia bacterium]
MLKKITLTMLIFIASCSLLGNVILASENATVYLSSNKKEANKDEEIEITVNIQNTKTAACNIAVYFEETKVEFISDIENTNLVENKVNFVWFDQLGGEGAKEGEIVTFKFRAKEDGLVTFTVNGEFYNQKGQLIETDFKEEQVQIGKPEIDLQNQLQEEQGSNPETSNCNLKTLRVDAQGLTPTFEPQIEEYYLVVPNSIQSVDVLAVSDNPNAIVDIKGNTDLKEKINDIKIQVTSADKTKSKVYTIHVSKTDNVEIANTNLEILAIENVLLNPPFEALQTNYKVEVSNETENLNIFAVPENEKATVEINGKDNLKEGNNLVTVVVKAQDKITTKTYRINVNRRNLEEEKKYQEEKEKQKEELENAYKIEKTSATIDNSQEQSIKNQKFPYKTIAILTIGVLIIALIVWGIVWRIKKR